MNAESETFSALAEHFQKVCAAGVVGVAVLRSFPPAVTWDWPPGRSMRNDLAVASN